MVVKAGSDEEKQNSKDDETASLSVLIDDLDEFMIT